MMLIWSALPRLAQVRGKHSEGSQTEPEEDVGTVLARSLVFDLSGHVVGIDVDNRPGRGVRCSDEPRSQTETHPGSSSLK
jgi:hypothetical protein